MTTHDEWIRAQSARDLALARVEAAADPAWKDEALIGLWRLCLTRAEFFSDDVWDFVPHTREDRAIGSVFQNAIRAGWIEKTGEMRPSVRSHLSAKPVWRSRVYGFSPAPGPRRPPPMPPPPHGQIGLGL